MPTRKQIGAGGAILAVLTLGAVHWGDDVARALRMVDPPPVQRPLVDLPPVHPPPIDQLPPTIAEIDQALETFEELRRGGSFDQAAVKVGCAITDVLIDQSPTHDQIENQIYARLPDYLPPNTPITSLVTNPVDKVTNTLTVLAKTNGGIANYYVRLCVANNHG